MSAIEEHPDSPRFRWAAIWLQVVPFLTSFLLHALIVTILGLWVIPALTQGLNPRSIDATITREDTEQQQQQFESTTFEVQSDSDAAAAEASMATAAESVAPVIETSEAKVRVKTSTRVQLPSVTTLSHMSDETLMESVPVLMAAMPMHQHRGETRVAQVKGTGEIATTLDSDLRSISKDGDAVIVWMLDQSLSMQLDIKHLAEQMAKTLLEIEEDKTSKMLHYVVAFGDDVKLIHDSTIKSRQVIRSIYNLPADPSGVERTFAAVDWCVDNLFNSTRWMRGGERQKLLVLWTDESGDDYLRLENTIQKCLQSNVRVDIIGPSSVLGAQTGFTAFEHPVDQLTYQLPVHRGPDSSFPQKLLLGYWYRGVPSNYDERIRGPWPGTNVGYGGSNFDSMLGGFSPYALTRLARQTGGRYTIYDRVGDRAPFTLEQVREYMPDYRSFGEIMRDLQNQPLRQLVLASAAETWRSSRLRYSQPRCYFGRWEGGENPNEFRTSTLPRQLRPSIESARETSIEVERALAVFAQAATRPAYKPRLDYGLRDGLNDPEPKEMSEDDSASSDSDAQGESAEMMAEKESDKKSDASEQGAGEELAVDESLLEQLYKAEKSKRWRAWCDLNLGRLLAISVRLREYGIAASTLLQKTNGLKPDTNDVALRPSRVLRGGPLSEQRRAIAIRVLQRCVDENPDTPWAVMAERELRDGFGFVYRERYKPKQENPPRPPPPPSPPLPNL